MLDLQKLKLTLQGEVLTDDSTLAKFSNDASIFTIRPQVIVRPKDVDDLKRLVKFVAAEKVHNPGISITPRAAGSDMSGGAVGDSIIADFTAHFSHIIDIKPTAPEPILGIEGEETCGEAIVEPGVFYRDFEPAALANGLLLPCYTASKSMNTVGGMAANNSAGEKTLSYGQTKDYVEELNVVLSDGQEYTFGPLTEANLEAKLKYANFEGDVYRKVYHLIKENYDLIKRSKPNTTKNSAGYLLWEVWDGKIFNLAKLFVGSQGTLGLITKIKIRLVKPKFHSELLIIFLKNKDFPHLGEIVHTIVQHKPETFESFDDHTFSMAMHFLPGMIKRMKGNIIKLGLSFLPELWMTLTGGVPKMILMAEFTGENEEVIRKNMLAAQQDVAGKYGLRTHITKNEAETQKYWTVRRESFSLLRQHTSGLHTAPFIDDIAVHPDDLPVFLPELSAILAKYPHLIYTIAGHAGDANFHIIPLMDLRKQEERAIIPKLSDEVYDLVLRYKGTITAEHNDGLVRGPYLEKMYGSQMFNLFKQVKAIFDPLNIFNPHKKTDATEEFLLAHIRHD